MTDEVIALRKYGVFVLTPQRRELLGRTLIDLERDRIDVAEAKTRLQGNILFTKDILNALEKAAGRK